MDNAVALASIALAGTMATGFFALINKLTKTMDRVAEATERTAKEAKERNGHLAKLVVQTAESIRNDLAVREQK